MRSRLCRLRLFHSGVTSAVHGRWPSAKTRRRLSFCSQAARKRTMTKVIVLATLCSILQGCVGVVVPKTQTTIISDPVVEPYSGRDYVFSGSAPDRFHQWYRPGVTNGLQTSECTSEWLQRYWGTPSHVRHAPSASEEVWTYKFDTAWEGIVPFAIVPIPLMLPIAKEKVCFSLRDGRVVSASVTESIVVGGTYGFIPNPEGGGGFGAWNWANSFK